MNFKLRKDGVVRLDDGAFIPTSPDNVDWKEFLAWQAAGNVPQPKDPDPVSDPSDPDDPSNTKTIKALIILIAQLTSTPIPQAKNTFKNIYRQLP